MLPLAEQSRALTPQLSARSMYNRCDSALKFPKGTPLLSLRCLPIGRSKLRMPIFSYFLVMGGVLTGLLLWFGNGSEPIGRTLTSQTVGIPQFKPEPEAEHARVTAFNFAAEYARSKRKPVKTAETPPRQKAATNYSKPQLLSHFAEFPHDNLSAH